MAQVPASEIAFSVENFWPFLSQYIDGNWIDISSLLIALVYAYWHNRKQNPRPKLISKATAASVANGTGLFPLLILGFSVVSSRLLSELLAANKITLSIAGFAALLSILDDD